jgi:hypothetical protein
MNTKGRPEPLALESDPRKLIEQAKEIVAMCRISAGKRAATAQEINTFVETGRPDGIRSLMNLLYYNENRVASHIFSPTVLKFTLSAEHEYPKSDLMRMQTVAKLITKNWAHNNTDILFAEGVTTALRYGNCIFKQWVEAGEADGDPTYARSLVMPWQFGVFREDITELHKQPAFVETNMLSLPEVWRRIYHFPDAERLLQRVRNHAQKDNAGTEAFGFLNQIFSTSTLQTGVSTPYLPKPGGIINMNPSPNFNLRGPQIGIETVPFHEIWIWDGDDYTTIQYIEPDILIAPRLKPCNLLVADSRLHPYSVIRPNSSTNNFWGRSEAEDIMELQNWISECGQDIKRLSALQIDKILGFIGEDGMTDEIYHNMRDSGFFSVAQGGSITDLTPSFPPQIIEILDKLMKILDKITGFDNILDGGGEPGVRSGNHAQTLIKTGSPTLRDRSLLVERQCSQAADLTYHLMRAKDATTYWTNPEKFQETSFVLGNLPADCMVSVDSHSSSPIFADDHTQLIFACVKSGIVSPKSAIRLLQLPDQDLLMREFDEAAAAKQAMMEKLEKTDHEAFVKLMQHGGGKK